MSKEIEDLKIFKKCPNGHIYSSDLDECPYCNDRQIEEDLEKLLANTDKPLPEIAMCYILPPKDW